MRKTVFIKVEAVWSTLSRPYPFKFFKGSLLQILLGPFNTLSHLINYTKNENTLEVQIMEITETKTSTSYFVILTNKSG